MNLLRHPSNIVFLVGFVVYLLIRNEFGRRTKVVEREISRVDTAEKLLMGIVFFGNLLIPVLYLFTPFFGFADYRMPVAAQICGGLIIVAALWLFWRSHADLGLNWSMTLQVRKEHQIITHGVYRRIRHPMYASIWLFGIAQALLLPNWFAGFSALVTFAPLYFIRTPREERMMKEFLGIEYRDYMKDTGRIFPRL